ncbi:DUF6705 family protein [uncultured Chryseobacterium sp.]|uniref:DUF6705 family protein n=1 Tax=uncultured Chryseobacterium sp. TaxID=259322 RepID=UPI0025FDEB5B|nr:DUF6705 family protein [uncultured Chryseobacterium sp.]
MKKILIIISIHLILLSCAQVYPLNTNTDIPTDPYIKDLNNELIPYEGTWKGTWDNKTIFIYFKKINKYMDHRENNPYYKDILIGKFKVINSNGQVLFDNTNLSDNDAKIEGGGFIKNSLKYLLSYNDPDICGMTGWVYITFNDAAKTKLNWKFTDTTDIMDSSCQYYNANPFSKPLPKEIILTKQ